MTDADRALLTRLQDRIRIEDWHAVSALIDERDALRLALAAPQDEEAESHD